MSAKGLLHDLEARAGARFGDYGGWQLPRDYGDVAAEYHAAREKAAIFDVSHRTKIELRGPDRVSFLQNFCTNDVAKLAEWEGCEAFLTTAQAKIVAYLRVFKQPDSLWIDADPGLGPKITQYLERFHIMEDVEIVDRTEELAQFHVCGSEQEMERPGILLADAQSRWEGQARGGVRNDVLGRPGSDLVVPDSEIGVVWNLTRFGFLPAGLDAYELLRVEAGTPEYGQDIDETNLPQEIGRDDRAVSFTKGCYVGQETVARIKAYGHVNRLLVGFHLEHSEPSFRGAKVLREGGEIGKITSCVLSPRFGHVIALGYVRRGHESPGTRVEVEGGLSRVPAMVSSLPFA